MQIEWTEPKVPRHVVQMFVFDRTRQILMFKRSQTVLSARGVWSLPSGKHRIGESSIECLIRELQEEFGLEALNQQLIGLYENIAGDMEPAVNRHINTSRILPQFHWVISLFLVEVKDITIAVNKEPDKHERMEFVLVDNLADQNFLNEYRCHNSLHTWLMQCGRNVIQDIDLMLDPSEHHRSYAVADISEGRVFSELSEQERSDLIEELRPLPDLTF